MRQITTTSVLSLVAISFLASLALEQQEEIDLNSPPPISEQESGIEVKSADQTKRLPSQTYQPCSALTITSEKMREFCQDMEASNYCDNLPTICFDCECPSKCVYGQEAPAVCNARSEVTCRGNRTQQRSFRCQYCFQSPASSYVCDDNYDCNSVAPPSSGNDGSHYVSNCTMDQETLCLGRREFFKRKKCNWTGGFQWSTALALSITLGGFGADR